MSAGMLHRLRLPSRTWTSSDIVIGVERWPANGTSMSTLSHTYHPCPATTTSIKEVVCKNVNGFLKVQGCALHRPQVRLEYTTTKVLALLNGLRKNNKNALSLKIFQTLVQIPLPPWLQTERTQHFPLPRVVHSRRGGAEGSHCRVLMEKSARHEWRGDLRQLLRLGRKTRAKAQHMEGIFVQQSTVVNLFISRLLWVTAAPLRTYAWKCSCKDIDSVKKLFQGSQVWYSSMITILIIYLE